VDIRWENGELAMATIKSLIGGNCRLRSYGPLKGKGLKYAQGLNPNPFFNISDIKAPLINSKVPQASLSLKKVYEYDLSTQKGEIIEISKQ
jgi:alpha-L-fucosidase 2